MAGRHATLDPVCVIGDGDQALALFWIGWRVEYGREGDLTPTPRLVQLLDGVVGRVQSEEDFQLFNWFWGEEYVVALIGVRAIGQKTRVINAWGGHGGKRINIHHARKGKVLRRNKSAQAVDARAAEDAMTALISAAVIQRLDNPAQPASSGTRILLGESVEGVWVDRTRMHGAKQTDEDRFTTVYPVTLDRLPQLAHLSAEDYAAHWRAVADELERAEKARRAAGIEVACEERGEPTHHPYFGNAVDQAAAMARYRTRVEGIREASAAWRAYARGRRPAPLRYPEGTHCPGALCRALPRALARCGDPPAGLG